MGTVISFPAERIARAPRAGVDKTASAAVIILPVVRIERYVDAPTGGYEPAAKTSAGRRRRRRATRS